MSRGVTVSAAAIPGSFRDPSGFVFLRDGSVYRQVNSAYRDSYDHLIASGLYDALVSAGLLVPHEEISGQFALTPSAYKVIKPRHLPFVSYPYEWCFSQLKHAALTTLAVQKLALAHGMSLKDSSAYNVQFYEGKPVFIDSLSFEQYREGQPWVAYRQFCQHFLAPLSLMSFRDVRLSQLLRVHLDGVPLDLAASLLPFRARVRPSLFTHVLLHAKSQRYFADKPVRASNGRLSRRALLGILDSLESAVEGLEWNRDATPWADYYEQTNYSQEALDHKRRLVGEFLDGVQPTFVWDLGANTGMFSRIASTRGIPTVSFDMDPGAVEVNYRQCVADGERHLLPLVVDLTNPSPSIGWENRERMSFLQRPRPDAVLALALIHHLVISNNLPLSRIAAFLFGLGRSLIIEFVPRSDSQVQRLLATRPDQYGDYTRDAFERSFGDYFVIRRSVRVADTDRQLYLMEKPQT